MRNNVARLNNVVIALSTMFIALVLSPSIQAMTPSPALIAQFKSLPAAEQQRLAKQYGISPGALNNNSAAVPVATPTVVAPRASDKILKVKNTITPSATVKVKRYGYDLFQGQPSTYAPVSDIPIPAEYLMGPGDVVNIQLYGKENKKISLAVSRLGNIDLPNSGPMSVNGLTFEALQRDLSAKINEQYTGVKSHVSLGELRSIRVIITGEAYKPGSYTVSSLSTITQALFVSGGVSDIASLRNIQLKRGGKTVTTFDLYDLLMKGESVNDVRLRSGDVIFIPPVKVTATVTGEVRRPAIYELKGNETIKELIELAAGVKAKSFPKASVIKRYSREHLPTLINVDLTTKKGNLLKVSDGDVLTVQSTTSTIKNKVNIKGAVSRPGQYEWHKGLRINDLISSQWSDLKGIPDLNYALIVREVNEKADIKIIDFSLANVLNDGTSVDNHYLQPRDTIIIFNKNRTAKDDLLAPIITQLKNQDSTLNITNVASVSGEVQFPGEYPISLDATVSDLIAAAGGLKESAYIKQAELTKFIVDDLLVAGVTHQSVNLGLALNNELTENVKINNRDKLRVLRIPSWQENMTISLRGEVKFPGTYSVREGETLDSVVTRAGGYTEKAFLEGAVFTRESVRNKERNQIRKFSDQLRLDLATNGLSSNGSGNSVSFSESSLMLKELESITPVGRMVISLSKDREMKHDHLLIEDNDMLYIPSIKQTVTVVGEVQHTTTHFYENDVTFDQYIALSGGIKSRADEGRIYIIQANGAVVFPEKGLWFSQSNNIKPGDTIVVPLNTEYKDNLTLWTQITSIVYNTAIALAAIGSL